MAISVTDEPLPFKPGDWACNADATPAIVKRVYRDDGEVLLDLVLYDTRTGKKLGRVSPACGGPRAFEPACAADGWTRISAPVFPIEPRWVDQGDGRKTLQLYAGKPLPPANWTPPKRRAAAARLTVTDDDQFRRALELIARGHNDARGLAAAVLADTKARA